MRFSLPGVAVVRALVVTVALSACGVGGALAPDEQGPTASVGPQFGKGSNSSRSSENTKTATPATPTSGGSSGWELSDSDQKALEDFFAYLVSLLPCSPQPYSSTVATIGKNGGVLVMGNHRLIVPSGALSGNVTLTGEVMPGMVNSVRLSPHGLQFAKPVSLVMSYSNCKAGAASKAIAYTDEDLTILETLSSADAPDRFEVTSSLDHFSRYAVAW